MKFLSLVIVSALVFANAYSQEKKGFLAGLGLGPSFPVGKYGSKSATDRNAGLAQTGFSARVSGTYLFNATLGATLVVRLEDNKMSGAALRQSLLQSGRGYANISEQTGCWTVPALMAGPVWRVPLSHSGRTVFVTTVTAGGCKTYVPSYSYSALIIGNPPNGVTGGEAYTASRQRLPVAFCYEVRPELAFRLSKSLYLTACVSYFGTASQKYIPIHNGSIVFVGGFPNEPPYVYVTYAHTSLSSVAGEAGLEIRL